MYTEYRSRYRRRRITIVVLLATLILVFLYKASLPDLSFISLGVKEDVSCHYGRNGAMPTIDKQFFPLSNSIFFHETSCKKRLDSREACSIEAASRAHPDWEVHVLFSAPVDKLSLGDVNFELLRMLKNVRFWRVSLFEYAEGTPLEDFISSGALNRSSWPISHTSDMLKYLTLYKFGGIYLDLDAVVLKPLGGLKRNWAVRGYKDFVGAEALSFYRDSLGAFIANAAVRTLPRIYRGDVSDQNGERVVTRVLKDVCNTDDVKHMDADKCLGFEVHPPSFIQYVDPSNQGFFEAGNLIISEAAYIFHLRSDITKNFKVIKDSPYAKLAKRHCPVVFETYKYTFGI